MASKVHHGDCCSDRYATSATHNCECGCGLFYCEGCYNRHCQGDVIPALRAALARAAEQARATEDAVTELRRQLTIQRDNNHDRNRALDALHYVWCDGGCKGGVHRYCGSPDDITEEVVQTVERQAERLRNWFKNRKAKSS